MKTPKNILAALGVSVVALGLAGCSYPGSDADAAAQNPTTSTQAPTTDAEQSPAPAEEITDAPTVDVTEPADAGDSAVPTEAPATEEPDENAVDLSAEEGTVYLYAEQAFSPRLQRWVVDGDWLLYQELDCLGRTKKDVEASLVDTGSNTYVATWLGDNPVSGSPDSELQITDAALVSEHSSAGIASSRAEAQASIYQDMCIEAGGTIANFIF